METSVVKTMACSAQKSSESTIITIGRADGKNLIELFRDGLFAEDIAEQTQRQRRGLDELIQKEQRQHDRDGGNKALEIAEKAARMDA